MKPLLKPPSGMSENCDGPTCGVLFMMGKFPNTAEKCATILIAEDEPSVRTFMRIALGGLGYLLLESAHGHDAIQLSEAYTGPIHILLTDLTMPGMTGIQLAENLLMKRPFLKVLYLSGMFEEDVFPNAVPPNSAFLQKPFTIQSLLTSVRELLERPWTIP